MNILELASNSITADLPCGIDCKYEVEYEALDAEISKQNSIDQLSPTNWLKVNTLCVTILSQKSKSLNAAVYLFYAELKLNGLVSLCESTQFFYEFLNNFWEGMFPPIKRLAGRKNIIDWWIDRFGDFVRSSAVNYLSVENSSKIIDYATMIDAFIADKLPDCSSIEPIIKELKSKIVAPIVAEKQEEAANNNEQPQKIAETNISNIQNHFAIDENKSPEETIKTTIKIVDEIFGNLLKNGYMDVTLFKISRLRAWGDITELPLHDGLKTYISPPNTEMISIIENLLQKNDYHSALWVVESRLCEMPLWLDLQKYAYDCLIALNEHTIAESISLDTKLFIFRLPGIENLKFNDEQPLASSNTKMWLDFLNKTNDNVQPNEQIQVMIDLLTGHKITEVLQVGSDIISSSANMAVKLKTYSLMLQALTLAKNTVVFESYATDVIKIIDDYKAYAWDKELVIDIYEIILNSLSLSEAISIDYTKLKLDYCRLDPVGALKIFL